MEPSFLHRHSEFMERVTKSKTDIRLLAKADPVEVLLQEIAEGATIHLDSSEEWQGFEFIYILEGNLLYTDNDPPIVLRPGDYIARSDVPERSWFKAQNDVVLLCTFTRPAFHLLREEIEDYLELAQEIESAEHMDGHSKRLEELSVAVGRRLGLKGQQLANLSYAAFFHDLGKANVPDEILTKNDKLTEEEWEIVERHPTWGREMLKERDFLAEAGRIVEQTHERVDGRGYPRGLTGEEIMLEAKVISVVDAYDAMTSDRAYRKALSEEEAVKEIRRNAGTQFDARVVEVFLEVLHEVGAPQGGKVQKSEFKQESIRLQQRRYLLDLGEQILSYHQVDKILDTVARAITESTTFQRAIIALYDRPIDPEEPAEGSCIVDYSHSGLDREKHQQLKDLSEGEVEVDVSKFDERFLLGSSYYIPHDVDSEDFRGEALIESDYSHEGSAGWHPSDLLVVPLYEEDHIVGHISIDDPQDGQVPSEKDLRPVEAFANLAATAVGKLNRAREVDAAQSRMENLEKLGRRISSNKLTPEKMAEILVGELSAELDCDYGAFFLREEGGFELAAAAGTGNFPEEGTVDELWPVPRYVAEKREPLLVKSDREKPGFLSEDQFNSYLSVPVEDKSGLLGVIDLRSKQQNGFRDQDLKYLSSAASLFGLALQSRQSVAGS